MHEHFYLINDASTIRSIAESNKHDQKKVVSSTITEEIKQNEDSKLDVILIDRFDVETARNGTRNLFTYILLFSLFLAYLNLYLYLSLCLSRSFPLCLSHSLSIYLSIYLFLSPSI